MKVRLTLVAVVLVVALTTLGCQRIKTETAGGGAAKNQPQYDEKLQQPDPNQPGNKQ